MLVHVFDRLQYLRPIALHLKLCESLAPLYLLIQGRVAAQFHYNVDILLVFEKVFELNDIRMMHRPVDADLTLEFLFGARLRKSRFGYDFDSL